MSFLIWQKKSSLQGKNRLKRQEWLDALMELDVSAKKKLGAIACIAITKLLAGFMIVS